MCGRFIITTSPERWVDLLQVPLWPEEWVARYNVAPTQLTVCVHQHDTARQAVMMKWGLVPSWAKDLKIGARMINARSETAADKPAFRSSVKKRRCLVPADGFFEWEKVDSRTKQPWLVHLQDRQPFAFAGLWESWSPNGSNGDPVLSYSVLTTGSNREMAEIHDRMPIVVSPENYATWLSPDASPGQVQELMEPLPDGSWDRYRVDSLVGNVRNDVPQCIQPLKDESESGTLF